MSAASRAPLPPAHLEIARRIGAMIPQLLRQDVVLAVLPDGEEHLVKGRKRLGEIIDSGKGAALVQTKVPVPSIELAIALERELGSDGNLVRCHFGNVLYGGGGHA